MLAHDAPSPLPFAILQDLSNSVGALRAVAGPHASGASARRWGPPQPTAAPDAASASPDAATLPAAEAVRETGTIASLKPHYGFIR